MEKGKELPFFRMEEIPLAPFGSRWKKKEGRKMVVCDKKEEKEGRDNGVEKRKRRELDGVMIVTNEGE